jgi:hypothetical protein
LEHAARAGLAAVGEAGRPAVLEAVLKVTTDLDVALWARRRPAVLQAIAEVAAAGREHRRGDIARDLRLIRLRLGLSRLLRFIGLSIGLDVALDARPF